MVLVSLMQSIILYHTLLPRAALLGIKYLRANPIITAKPTPYEAMLARLEVVQLHVPQRQVLPTTISTEGVCTEALSLLVNVDVLRLGRQRDRSMRKRP